MRALKPRACLTHCLERTRSLIDTPFSRAADVAGRHVDRFARKDVLLVPKCIVSVDSIVVEAPLEAGPRELCCVNVEIGLGHPLA